MLRWRPFVSLFAFLSLWLPLRAAHVEASLVASDASIRPGTPVTVAIRLVHEAHWHTYWVNPGTGYATSITWELPPGWKAGEIAWPDPQVITDGQGMITGSGYEGDVLLPVVLTPPADLAPGSSVILKGKVDWLMCSNVCVPGTQKVDLTLPVSREPAQPDKAWHERISASPLPQPLPPAWTANASRSGKTVHLTVQPAADQQTAAASAHFFSLDGFIQYDQPQTVHQQGAQIVFDLPISDSAEANTDHLSGVLVLENPRHGYTIDLPFGAATAPAATSGASPGTTASLWSTLVLAIFGGMILNLMPCVFPVLGIKILGFVNQSGADRRKVTLHGLAFTAGVLISFWTLAGMLIALRAGGSQLGWGFQLQSPAFVFALALLLLVFAMSMSGVFEFGLSATGVGASWQMKSGYGGSFATGVLATVVATPCSAPFLAPALGAALALAPVASIAVFTAIAVGLSTPYLLLSIFPQAVKLLPRPGAWMETFKQFMAFPLYATTGYLVWVLAGQLAENDSGLLMVLFGLTVCAMGVWFYGRWSAPGASPQRARFGLLVGVGLLAVGAWLGWPQAGAPTGVKWEKWSPEAVAAAQAQGRPIYVDFTARWCATCQANKKLVFTSAEVLRKFRDNKVVALKGDWTNKDEHITAELAKYNRSAVPFNLVYKPGSAEPIILPELLTPGKVLSALE